MIDLKKLKEIDVHELYPKIVRFGWIGLALGFLVFLGYFIFVSLTQVPNTKELENPKYELTTIIYDDANSELGRVFSKNREWVNYDEMSPYLIEALVATEDIRFYKHSGIDGRGTARAVLKLGTAGGASTVTQQLAKLFYTDRSRNKIVRVMQKVKEWAIAVQFEKRYTKEEILAMFLNEMDFINDAIGINSAAKTYFGKEQADLELEEAAMLIGMLKNPYLYNPIRNPELALKRREVVLKQMVRAGLLSEKDYNEKRNIPFDSSKFRREDQVSGIAPYFRAELTKYVKKMLKEGSIKKADGNPYNIYNDGLKIYTTINSRMQRHAEGAMRTHMAQLQESFFNHWGRSDLWESPERNIRKVQERILLQKSKQSVRYKRLRAKYLTLISSKLSQNIEGVRLYDGDIERMIKEYKKPGYLEELIEIGHASTEQVKTYREIIQSDLFPDLITQWNKLQNSANVDFTTNHKTEVYDYKTGGDRILEMSPLDSIKYLGNILQLGSMSMVPKTGEVKTWVGGVDFDYFKYDHVTSNRQVGSTFKAFLYSTAILQSGIPPCTKVIDQQYTIPAGDPYFNLQETWAPQNSNKKFSGTEVTLFTALQKSLNSISVWLMKEIGSAQKVKEMAVNFGLPANEIPAVPSLALGTASLSVKDMTTAYNVFANNGIYTSPVFIYKIVDAEDRVIYSSNSEQRKVLKSEENYVMLEMLKRVATNDQYKLHTEFGGKTGTTDDQVDGWYMGVTPNLTVGTWVGGDHSWVRFNSLGLGAGSRMAKPFFIDFIRRVENDPKLRWNRESSFQYPDNGPAYSLDCSVYQQFENIPEPEKKKDELELEEDLDFE